MRRRLTEHKQKARHGSGGRDRHSGHPSGGGRSQDSGSNWDGNFGDIPAFEPDGGSAEEWSYGGESGAEPGDALAIALALGRGINLGNILEAPSEGAWGLRLTDDLVAIWRQLAKRDAMKARGFTWAYWQLAAAFGIYQLGTELAGGVAGCAVSLGRT